MQPVTSFDPTRSLYATSCMFFGVDRTKKPLHWAGVRYCYEKKDFYRVYFKGTRLNG